MDIGRLDEPVAVAGSEDSRSLAVSALAEQVDDALMDPPDSVHPCQQVGILERLDGFGDGRARTAGLLRDRFVRRKAKPADRSYGSPTATPASTARCLAVMPP